MHLSTTYPIKINEKRILLSIYFFRGAIMHQFVTRSEGRRDCLQKWYFCATICCFRESILVALEIKNRAFQQ